MRYIILSLFLLASNIYAEFVPAPAKYQKLSSGETIDEFSTNVKIATTTLRYDLNIEISNRILQDNQVAIDTTTLGNSIADLNISTAYLSGQIDSLQGQIIANDGDIYNLKISTGYLQNQILDLNISTQTLQENKVDKIANYVLYFSSSIEGLKAIKWADGTIQVSSPSVSVGGSLQYITEYDTGVVISSHTNIFGRLKVNNTVEFSPEGDYVNLGGFHVITSGSGNSVVNIDAYSNQNTGIRYYRPGTSNYIWLRPSRDVGTFSFEMFNNISNSSYRFETGGHKDFEIIGSGYGQGSYDAVNVYNPFTIKNGRQATFTGLATFQTGVLINNSYIFDETNNMLIKPKNNQLNLWNGDWSYLYAGLGTFNNGLLVANQSTSTFTGPSNFQDNINLNNNKILNVKEIHWADGTVQVSSPTASGGGVSEPKYITLLRGFGVADVYNSSDTAKPYGTWWQPAGVNGNITEFDIFIASATSDNFSVRVWKNGNILTDIPVSAYSTSVSSSGVFGAVNYNDILGVDFINVDDSDPAGGVSVLMKVE